MDPLVNYTTWWLDDVCSGVDLSFHVHALIRALFNLILLRIAKVAFSGLETSG